MPKILVAIDGSDHANRAFAQAVRLFGPDAEYVMLSVVPPWSPAVAFEPPTGTSTYGTAGGGMPLTPSAGGVQKAIEGMYDYFRQAQVQAERVAGVNAVGLIEEAKASKRKIGKMVVDIAEEQEADAIVIGAHGASFVGGVLLGSVSQFVVHHAHCPVVVSRQPD